MTVRGLVARWDIRGFANNYRQVGRVRTWNTFWQVRAVSRWEGNRGITFTLEWEIWYRGFSVEEQSTYGFGG